MTVFLISRTFRKDQTFVEYFVVFGDITRRFGTRLTEGAFGPRLDRYKMLLELIISLTFKKSMIHLIASTILKIWKCRLFCEIW